MMQRRTTIGFLVVLVGMGGALRVGGEDVPRGAALLSWKQLPELPDPVGVAAPFAGVSGDALIVAGGANFPEAPPWNGGQKVWHDRIFVLSSPEGAWQTAKQTVPRVNAYGVSIARDDAVICIGGCGQLWNAEKQSFDFQECYDDLFVMQWTGGEIKILDKLVGPKDNPADVRPLPKLPRPLAFMAGALLGDAIYVAGGQEQLADGKATTNFWRLDLAQRKNPEKFRWEELPWPEEAAPRVLPVVAVQSDGRENCLFMFSGRDAPGHEAKLLRDAWKFSPSRHERGRESFSPADGHAGAESTAAKKTPDPVAGWTRIADAPRCLMAGVAAPMGTSGIVTIGGDDGENFGKDLRDEHPGFARDMLFLYDTVTDRWSQRGELPANHVTTTAVQWHKMLVIPSGEIRPGIRSPNVWAGERINDKRGFVAADWVVMALYMLVLVGIGVYFARRENTTDDYFLAGRRVPWWAAGLSIFATMLSAITYLSIPAKTFNTDWAWFLVNMGIIAVAPVVAYVYLPFFRRLSVASAYEYLEKRFSLGLRLFGSISFMAFQLGRMGIVVLLPALALAAVTGIDVYWCIIAMGALSTIYTVLGGIEAVIWTDVLQTVVLLGGAIAAVVVIATSLDGGLGEVISAGHAAGKFRLAHFEWGFTGDTLLVIVLGAVFANLVPYTSDQAVIQRYLTTSDERRARGAIWTNAALSGVSSVLFFGVGTGLFVYYQTFPERLAPLNQGDQIFPWFIAHEMHWGFSGLVISGVLAASMSSLDSSMHSISTAFTTDFVERLAGLKDQRRLLRIARLLVFLLGMAGTASALYLATLTDKNLWERFMGYMGLVGGTVAGLFALGIFTRRPAGIHAWIGAAASIGVLAYLQLAKIPMAGLLNAAVAIVTCFSVGWLASWAIPSPPASTSGLTIHTIERTS